MVHCIWKVQKCFWVSDKFNDLHFLADVDRLLYNLKTNDIENDKLNEVNALTVWYLKEMKKQKEDPSLRKVNSYLRKENIKTVPFDKGAGFCLMSDADYFS